MARMGLLRLEYQKKKKNKHTLKRKRKGPNTGDSVGHLSGVKVLKDIRVR
jgi:hypothetical protein